MIYPHALEASYSRALLPIARACERELERVVIPALPSMGVLAGLPLHDSLTADLGQLGRAAALAVTNSIAGDVLTRIVSAKAEELDYYQRRSLTKYLAAATGIESLVGRMMSAPEEGVLVSGFVQENVALIKSIPEEYFRGVERKVFKAAREGVRVETLARQLRSSVDMPRNRARLIARDQIGKLYGQLNETRQQSVGIKTYVWRTMQDERVRAEHKKLDGKVYSWKNAPVTNKRGTHNHPGGDYQCRCTAEPNLAETLFS